MPRDAVLGLAARGVVAAITMSIVRSFTTRLGLVELTPPERLADEAVPHLLRRLPPDRRDEAVELFHWAFGGAAGAAYALLPERLRDDARVGVAYGLAIWSGYETVVAPLLAPRRTTPRPLRERIALAADHVVYGAVLAA